MEITYFGTAMLSLRVGGLHLLTDPVLDPRGATYDFGPWYAPRRWFASEKQYDTPALSASERFDAVLLSHDHHGDNFDLAARRLVADERRVARVITTAPGAARLRAPASAHDAPGRGLGLVSRASGLRPGQTERVGSVSIRATPARHGPHGTPRIHEVVGFVLDVDQGPRVWISGDTVLYPALASVLVELKKERPVDVAVIHCGGVRFPSVPVLSRALFTFDAAQVVAACRLLEPRLIVPVHRSGWAHFRQPEGELKEALGRAGLAEHTRFLELGESFSPRFE